MQEGLEGGGIVNVVVKGDNTQNSGAVVDVSDEGAGVAAQIMSDDAAPRDKLPLAGTRVPPGVHHHLGTLVHGEVWVVDVPVGVSGPSENIDAVVVGVVMCHTNTREPQFHNT